MKTGKIAALVLVAAFAAFSPAPAQERPIRRARPGVEKDAPASPADASVQKWVAMLSTRIADSNKTIRKSVQAALVAVGQQALPQLMGLAEGGEGAVAAEARKVIQRIKNRGARGRRDGAGQDRRGRFGGRAQERTKAAIDKLGLEPEVRQKVDAALEAYRRGLRELRERAREGDMDRAEMREEFQQLRSKMNADLKAVLTPEQFETLQKSLRGGRRGGPGRGGRGRGTGGGRGGERDG